MPVFNEFKGSADATFDVVRIAVHDAVPGALYHVALVGETSVEVRGQASDTVHTIASRLANSLGGIPGVAVDYSGGNSITLTGATAGIPLAQNVIGSHPSSSFVERVQAGQLPQLQRFLVTLPATSSGGTWTLTLNGSETTSGLNHNATPAAVAAALNGLATPEAGDITVSLVSSSPRQYEVTVGGSLAGVPITLTANGATLTGNASASVQRVQSIAGNPPEVWYLYGAAFSGGEESLGAVTVVINGVSHAANGTNNLSSQAWWNARLPSNLQDFLFGVDIYDFAGTDVANAGIILTLPESVEISIASGSWTAERKQAYQGDSNRDYSLANDAGVISLVTGSEADPSNDIHAITILGATGGTWTAQIPGYDPTSALAPNASAADLKTAIEATLTVGETVAVTQQGNSWAIEYTGDLAEITVPLITVDVSGLTGGAVAVVQSQLAQAGMNEIQRVKLDSTVVSGTWFLLDLGNASDILDWDATASAVQAAFEVSSGVGNVSVDGITGDYLVEWIGDRGQQPTPLLEINQDSLIITGLGAFSVEYLSRATGPNHWNNPSNWTLGHVPGTGETAVFTGGNAPVRYGLIQQARCEFDGSDVVLTGSGDLVDDQAVRLVTSGDFPDASDSEGAVELDPDTDYYIIAATIREDGRQAVKLSQSVNGPPITFDNAGSGEHWIGVQLAALEVQAGYIGLIGWNRRVNNRWVERQRFLAIGLLPSAAGLNVSIGAGAGSGPALVNLDAGPSPVSMRVIKSQSGANEPSISFRGDNLAETEVFVVGGHFGLGLEPGDEPAIRRLVGFAGRTLIGSAQFERIESYQNSVEFTQALASGDVLQIKA